MRGAGVKQEHIFCFFVFLARNESFLLDTIFNFLYIQETPLGRGVCACNPRNQPTCFSF